MPYVDFTELKSRHPIEDIADLLGIELKKKGEQLRGHCPWCQGGSDRAFVVTPSKQVFYCFCPDHEGGGDSIELAARMYGVTPKEAAAKISAHFTAPKAEGLKHIDYLQPQHPALEALGLLRETCEHFKAGYKPKGVLSGRLAIPLYRNGTLVGYAGRAVLKDGKKDGKMLEYHAGFDPSGIIFEAFVENDEEPVMLFADPLKAMLSFQHGVSAIAVLGTLDPDTVKALARYCEEKTIVLALN